MLKPSSPHDFRGNRPRKGPAQTQKNVPEKDLFQRGLAALRNISTIQALVAISAITAATTYGVKHYSAKAAAEAQVQEQAQEKVREAMKPYTPEAYPTVESRVAYLQEKYGLEARVLDGDELHDENHITIRTETDDCGCKEEHLTEHDLPRKVQKGDPKNFLPFLDEICRAVDKYPFDLFKKMRGLKIRMAGKIEIEGLPGGVAAGYANGASIVMVHSVGKGADENVFDHEFFHSLDSRNNDLTLDDDRWIEKTHSKGKYQGNHIVLDDPPWTPPAGFARKYGMFAVPEDQATMAENFFQPHFFKFMLRRALNGDSDLFMRIQLLTASIIDPHTERFVRTMTPEEYKKYSGFDGYRYFHAWSPKMDHAYWNAVLNSVSGEKDSREGIARNMYDASADLIFHIVGDSALQRGQHSEAAYAYQLAHESKLATSEYLTAAVDAEKKKEWINAAVFYDGAGEKTKAKLLYEKVALQEAANRYFSGAALHYAKAGNMEKAQLYASKFFEEMNGIGDPTIFDDLLIEISEECYHWKNIPEIGTKLLHDIAKKRGGVRAIMIFEKLGEVRRRVLDSEVQKNDKKHMAESRSEADIEVLIDRWYLKMAKRLEAGGKDLGKVASLYEKGGDFEAAKRCLELYRDVSMGTDWLNLADSYRKLADLEVKVAKRK